MQSQQEIQPLLPALKRLAATYIREVLAIRNGGSCDPEELIHLFRVTLKRQRAFWRLLSPAIPPAVFRRENARLRNAGRRLSAGRNETAALKTMGKIALNARGGKAVDSASRVLSALRRQMYRSREREEALLALPKVQSSLKETLQRFEELSPAARGWNLIEPGLRIARRKVHQASNISRNSSEEKFHRWRKRIKNLWYQLAALHSIRPHPPLEKLLRRLDALQEQLGDAHDLIVLKERLRKAPSRFGGSEHVENVIKSIDFKIKAERRRALRLGKEIPDRKPAGILKKLWTKKSPLPSREH